MYLYQGSNVLNFILLFSLFKFKKNYFIDVKNNNIDSINLTRSFSD
jgi:hypothetical protein